RPDGRGRNSPVPPRTACSPTVGGDRSAATTFTRNGPDAIVRGRCATPGASRVAVRESKTANAERGRRRESDCKAADSPCVARVMAVSDDDPPTVCAPTAGPVPSATQQATMLVVAVRTIERMAETAPVTVPAGENTAVRGCDSGA